MKHQQTQHTLHHIATLLATTLLVSASANVDESRAQENDSLNMIINVETPGPTISKHIYGHFTEHLGRGIYGGFWRREDGGEWRLNEPVVEAMRNLNPPNIRWPGGCFADTYHWRDGVGPVDDRPTIVNTHWGGITEDNSFGTHEYMALIDALGAEPFVVGNVGSGTVEEMSKWWEYLNHPGPSPMADLRASNGQEDPWNVRFWGVGNENWGCGGHMNAEYYTNLYKRFATYLHHYGEVRPFRIAMGPYAGNDRLDWTETLMKEAGHMIDGLNIHYYTVVNNWQEKGSATDFTETEWITALHKALYLDQAIEAHSAVMDRYDPEKRVWLIVGEWGMWHDVEPGTNPGFLHQQSTLRDAMVAALTLNTFNRHADRVRMANIAQTINVLQAMILTNEANELILTPTYHVFEMFKGHQDAALLPIVLDEGTYTLDDTTIAALSASASQNEDGRILITIANTDPHAGRTVEASLRGTDLSAVSGRILTADAMHAHNTFENPHFVVPVEFDGATIAENTLTVDLPAKSIVSLELQ